MILPLGDSPNPPGTPIVTYALIAVNVAVYLAISLPLSYAAPDLSDPALLEYLRLLASRIPGPESVDDLLRRTSAYDVFVFTHGFRPAAPGAVDLFVSLFLHGGLLHLFGNMLFLWIYGDNVEHRLGAVPYLLAYLGTGVAATLFHTLFALDSPLPLVGASGAISGVLGFYFLWFPRNRVRLLVLLIPFIMDVVLVPARLVLGLYLIIDNLLPFLVARGAEAGVAHGAHIGGFLAGLAIARGLDRRELAGGAGARRRPVAAGGDGRAGDAIRSAVSEGRFADGAEMYFRLPPHATRWLLAPADSLALADWLRERDHAQAALAVYRRHLRDYPRGPGVAEAHLGAGLVLLEGLEQPVPAYQHLLDALDADPRPPTAARARAALEAIAARQKSHGRRALGRWGG